MKPQLFIFLQKILPQHLLSRLAGKLADTTSPRIKKYLINQFIKKYKIDLSEALIKNADDYISFNDFFTRQLRPELRPITQDKSLIISPVDGVIAEIGNINQYQLLQAKNTYYELATLLGADTNLANHFYDGKYATFYLAPHNYHRVHMPLSGKLIQTIYVPGKLFSVNRITTDLIPNLYGRNERLICIFDTCAGRMAVILVGAMIVGSMKTVWLERPIRSKQIVTEAFEKGIEISKGEELGYFKLGSTVIVLFEKNKIQWDPSIRSNLSIRMGQSIGALIS